MALYGSIEGDILIARYLAEHCQSSLTSGLNDRYDIYTIMFIIPTKREIACSQSRQNRNWSRCLLNVFFERWQVTQKRRDV